MTRPTVVALCVFLVLGSTTASADGVAQADSSDFILNMTGTIFGVEIGLRAFDGTNTIKIAAEPFGTLTSLLRISKNGTNYGVVLVPTNATNASKFCIQTSQGTKALMKLP